MSPDVQFISEPVEPDAGSFDARAMARGIPGIPAGFRWRGEHYAVTQVLEEWKVSESEDHTAAGERYYRKHFYRVRTDRGPTMTLYAVRRVKRGESPKRRWWLYTIEGSAAPRLTPRDGHSQ